MNTNSSILRSLGALLVELASSEPTSRVDLRAWTTRSEEALKLVSQLSSLGVAVPELVHHYLSDADIRLKDRRYAEMQMPRVKEVTRLLQKGVIEGADDI